MIKNWIIVILWICCVWSYVVAAWDTLCENELTNFEKGIVVLIIFVGAPVFAFAGMLESFMDLITGGSDDDEGPVP